MTRTKAEQLLQDFIAGCNKDGDPYFYCFFSRQEDKFVGDWEGLDELDAFLIVKELEKKFPFIKNYFYDSESSLMQSPS
jgi:hypothetical protein